MNYHAIAQKQAESWSPFGQNHDPSFLSAMREAYAHGFQSAFSQYLPADDILDFAETIICNARPMPHVSQEEWDKATKEWLDRKHLTHLAATGEAAKKEKIEKQHAGEWREEDEL